MGHGSGGLRLVSILHKSDPRLCLNHPNLLEARVLAEEHLQHHGGCLMWQVLDEEDVVWYNNLWHHDSLASSYRQLGELVQKNKSCKRRTSYQVMEEHSYIRIRIIAPTAGLYIPNIMQCIKSYNIIMPETQAISDHHSILCMTNSPNTMQWESGSCTGMEIYLPYSIKLWAVICKTLYVNKRHWDELILAPMLKHVQ